MTLRFVCPPARLRRALLGAALIGIGSTLSAQDACIRPARIRSGPGDRSYYATVTAVDAGGPDRSLLSPFTCSRAEFTRLGEYTRVETVRNLRGLDALITRNRDELIVLSYNQVASLLPRTLKARWSIPMPSSPGQDWNLPGGMAAHANGLVYVVKGRLLLAIDPTEGVLRTLTVLPVPHESYTVAYDGVLVLPDGRLLLKSLIQQRNGPASRLLVVNEETLEVMHDLELPERIVPRITLTVIKGQGYVYATGATLLHRYLYTEGRLMPDAAWGEIPYLRGKRSAGAQASAFGEWIVVQSNATPADEPLVLSAIHQINPSRRFRYPTFGEIAARAWTGLPVASDPDNKRLYAISQGSNELVALNFDPANGFTVAWAVTSVFAAPVLLIGPSEERMLLSVETETDPLDPAITLERLVWRLAQTGEEITRSEALPVGAGLLPVPAFGGTFYHLAPKQGHLSRVEFTHEPPPGGLFGKDGKKKPAPKPGGKK